MVQTAVLQAEPTFFMALATEYPPQVLLCTFPAPSSYPVAPFCYVCAQALQAELSPCSLGPGRFVEAELFELLLF